MLKELKNNADSPDKDTIGAMNVYWRVEVQLNLFLVIAQLDAQILFIVFIYL